MSNRFRIRRRASGSPGAPPDSLSDELFYNRVDQSLWIGHGDDGLGNATSILQLGVAGRYIPAGGTTGQVPTLQSNGTVAWGNAGATYTASGDGIELTGTNFALNYSEIITGIGLANYLTTTTAASTYMPKTGGSFSGKISTLASAAGGAGFNIPHGAAPTTPVDGDQWTTTTGMFARINGATKQQAFLDSALTGSAATLTTGRTIAMTGDVAYTSPAFNGSANVTAAATIQAGAVTLAKMANLAANSIMGNNTGVAATPIALTATQVKTMLAVAFTDLSGTASTAQIPALDAAKITTGTFTAAQIPALDAAKITTGTFAAARIPTIDLATMVTGVLGTGNIPNLDAGKITSGVLDINRIPVLPGTQTVVSSGDFSALTAPQQAAIAEGTIVALTDGSRYVYSGTGSKTLSTSYIQLADITPDWAAITSKPSFATVATSGAYADLTGKPSLATVATTGAYADLTGKPTLGTMASQNASAVAITGGTIDGIVLDGGDA